MDLAYEEILERNRNPVNYGSIENAQIRIYDSNLLCGDEIEIFLNIDGAHIKDMKFVAKGCSISKASVDILADYVIDKNINQVLTITNDEMLGLLGVGVSAMRLKCALLGLVALKKGVKEFKNDT